MSSASTRTRGKALGRHRPWTSKGDVVFSRGNNETRETAAAVGYSCSQQDVGEPGPVVLKTKNRDKLIDIETLKHIFWTKITLLMFEIVIDRNLPIPVHYRIWCSLQTYLSNTSPYNLLCRHIPSGRLFPSSTHFHRSLNNVALVTRFCNSENKYFIMRKRGLFYHIF